MHLGSSIFSTFYKFGSKRKARFTSLVQLFDLKCFLRFDFAYKNEKNKLEIQNILFFSRSFKKRSYDYKLQSYIKII